MTPLGIQLFLQVFLQQHSGSMQNNNFDDSSDSTVTYMVKSSDRACRYLLV